MGALHDAGLAVAPRGDVRVDLTALQRGERELGGDRHRGAEREDDDGQQAEHGQEDGHDVERAGMGVMRRGGPGALLQPGSPGRAVGTVRLLVKGCGPVYGSDHADLGTRPRTTPSRSASAATAARSAAAERAERGDGDLEPPPFWVGRHTPTTSTPDTTTPGAPSDVQICLRWAGSGTSSSRSRPCRYGSDGGSSRTTSRRRAARRRVDVGLGDQPRAALDRDRHRGGPVGCGGRAGGAEEARDVSVRCGREEPQVGGLQRGRARGVVGGRARPARDRLEREGPRSRHQPGPAGECREAQELLTDVVHPARPAERGQLLGDRVGDRAAELGLRQRPGQHRPDRLGNGPERPAGRAADLGEAFALPAEPGRGVGVVAGPARGREHREIGGRGAGAGRRAGSRPA